MGDMNGLVQWDKIEEQIALAGISKDIPTLKKFHAALNSKDLRKEMTGSIRIINKWEKYKIRIEVYFGDYYQNLENVGVNARYSLPEVTSKQQAEQDIGKSRKEINKYVQMANRINEVDELLERYETDCNEREEEMSSAGFLRFAGGKQAAEDDYEIPDEVETDIVPGDMFQIGPHRLLCGDSTDIDQIVKVMGGETADMLTDPPYGINANKQTLGNGRQGFQRGEDWDASTLDFYYLIPMFEKSIIWGGNYFTDRLAVTNDWLCWDKKKAPGLSFSEFELAWTNTGKNCRLISHHWSGEKKLHPTMKPVAVMAWCMSLLDNDIVFDPFIGSGSTMVAAHQLDRTCYAIELDPIYCQITIDRMKAFDPDILIRKV